MVLLIPTALGETVGIGKTIAFRQTGCQHFREGRKTMKDDRSHTGAKDRSQVNSDEDYKIDQLAKKFKVKPEVGRLASSPSGS